jgi:hypothetical protein
MSIDLDKYTAEELDIDKIDALTLQCASYQVVSVTNISATVTKIEGRIEKAGLSCRVYSEYRAASMATLFSPAAIVGLGAAVGIAAHNIATFNPDYEIAKNKLAGTLTVKYVK